MKFDLAGDELRCHFRVGGSSGAAAVDVGGDVMDFGAVLVRHYRIFRRASISAQNDAIYAQSKSYRISHRVTHNAVEPFKFHLQLLK